MHQWQSLSQVRWECTYHVVMIPKYRRKVFYGRLRRPIGAILRELCRQRGVELVEGHAMPDHGHPCLSVTTAFGRGLLLVHEDSDYPPPLLQTATTPVQIVVSPLQNIASYAASPV